jgi:hypothetical protein
VNRILQSLGIQKTITGTDWTASSDVKDCVPRSSSDSPAFYMACVPKNITLAEVPCLGKCTLEMCHTQVSHYNVGNLIVMNNIIAADWLLPLSVPRGFWFLSTLIT